MPKYYRLKEKTTVIYDTLIIGSGYTSLGYAIAKGNTIICEEREICDTQFYLSLKQYKTEEYIPNTEMGRNLSDYYTNMRLFREGMQNLNGFECAFCGFALQQNVEILLKCRVINYVTDKNGHYDIRVITGAGMEHIFAKRVIDLRPKERNKQLTILFTTNDEDADIPILESIFPEARVEKAFYESRYAIHIPVMSNADYNTAIMDIYRAWSKVLHNAKIVYIASAFATVSINKGEVPNDSNYLNPIAAFEAGVLLAGSEGRYH